VDKTSHTISVERLTKTFGTTLAVQNASFSISSNEVVALAGGNGSGKSTLLKMISGALAPDTGNILWDGKMLTSGKPRETRATGIEMVFQDCALCPDASVIDNLFLGREPTTSLGFLKVAEMRRLASEIIAKYTLPIPDINVETRPLSGGQQKAIAIGRALLSQPKLLLLDEPTAALGVKEQKIILQTIADLRTKGVGIILCTHLPDEILAVADRVLIMRRGELVGDYKVQGLTKTELAVLMST
jgi:ABC-type sugar transport system ATPase subunit